MKKKINISIWWSFWILFLEFIYKIFIIKEFFTLNTISVVLFSMPWICALSLITGLFREKINKILTIILSLIVMLLTLAQIVYFNFYNSIFSFFSLTTGTGQVMQFYEMIIEVILRIWYIFVIILVPFILFIIYNKKIFSFNKHNNKKILIILIALFMSLIGIIITININKKDTYSLKRLLYEIHAPMLTINKTGLNTMQLIDIYRYIIDFEEKLPSIQSSEDKEVFEEEELVEYNTLNIDFEQLINNETNNDIIGIHKYISKVIPTEKNEYTGMFEGKNLVFITAEAFDTIAIDENITPTLYKLANNSFVFNNYYQPLYPVSTSDGEYMNLISLIPQEGTWSFTDTAKKDMKYGIGNVFNTNGYLSYAFHNHSYKYYDRHLSHTNLGFNYMGCGNGLEKKMKCNHWPNSDYEMFESTTQYYINEEKPFLAYYMTVSGHLNYNFDGNNMAYRHKSEVSNLPYSTAVKAYYATQIELDKALEYLINKLEENKLLDDTLIIICPDHYPYGLNYGQINEVSKINRNDKFELYHTSLIMYNPLIETTNIDKTISGLDILPTIYNLFGIDYDSRLFMGKDIFSKEESMVVLSDRSWITEYGRYNSVSGEFIKTTTIELDEEKYIEEINNQVNQKFAISSSILENDYYSKVVAE